MWQKLHKPERKKREMPCSGTLLIRKEAARGDRKKPTTSLCPTKSRWAQNTNISKLRGRTSRRRTTCTRRTNNNRQHQTWWKHQRGEGKEAWREIPWRTRKRTTNRTTDTTNERERKGRGRWANKGAKAQQRSSQGRDGGGDIDKTDNATEDYLGEYCKIPKGKGERTINRHRTSKKHEKIRNIGKNPRGDKRNRQQQRQKLEDSGGEKQEGAERRRSKKGKEKKQEHYTQQCTHERQGGEKQQGSRQGNKNQAIAPDSEDIEQLIEAWRQKYTPTTIGEEGEDAAGQMQMQKRQKIATK